MLGTPRWLGQVRVCGHRRPASLVGLSANLQYPNVRVAQLFAWDREEHHKSNLGKLDLTFQVLRVREDGDRYMAAGQMYPYKRALFGDAIVGRFEW